jgi:hypothetical protein
MSGFEIHVTNGMLGMMSNEAFAGIGEDRPIHIDTSKEAILTAVDGLTTFFKAAFEPDSCDDVFSSVLEAVACTAVGGDATVEVGECVYKVRVNSKGAVTIVFPDGKKTHFSDKRDASRRLPDVIPAGGRVNAADSAMSIHVDSEVVEAFGTLFSYVMEHIKSGHEMHCTEEHIGKLFGMSGLMQRSK